MADSSSTSQATQKPGHPAPEKYHDDEDSEDEKDKMKDEDEDEEKYMSLDDFLRELRQFNN